MTKGHRSFSRGAVIARRRRLKKALKKIQDGRVALDEKEKQVLGAIKKNQAGCKHEKVNRSNSPRGHEDVYCPDCEDEWVETK